MHILLLFLAFDVCVCYHTILFNTKNDLRVAMISKPKRSYIIAKDQQEATALDYIHNSSLVCWTDVDVGQIECASFNGTSTTNKIVYAKRGLPSPNGLACDWLTKKLYWTDNEFKKIEVVSLESKHRKVIFWQDLDQPRGIAVDPTEGLLFWTDWGETPKIERASMDGNPHSRKIIIEENIYWPNSVSLDVQKKQLYWLDGRLLFIEVANYDGRERTILINKGLAYPFALSVADDKIYWTDWQTYWIYSIDRNGAEKPTEVIRFDKVPVFDIEVYDASHQPYKWTPCEINNGGCSHLCLLSSGPQKYTCACPTGIRQIDNRTCANQVENFILLVQRTEISIISLDTSEHSYIELPLSGVKHSMGIDYDPVEECFYWTDQEIQSVRRAKLDGSRQENVISADIDTPDGITIDWIARNIYWCDESTNRIEVARLNSSFRKVVIFEDLEKPRAVVVYPQQGWLFWSDWNEQKPKIERSDLDGSNRVVLVKSKIYWPNGLALDFENKRLYFGDARTDKIEVIGMDGHDRREVISDNLAHLFGLSLLGDQLYWTDWSRRTLETANKYSAQENRSVILEQLSDVTGLKAVRRYPPAGTNACAVNNGNCAQLCFHKPGKKYVCACQIEYELHTDNKNCVMPENYLIIQANNRMRRVSVQNGTSDVIPISEVKQMSAIDVSATERWLYWADNRTKTISRAFLNGSRVEKIVSSGLQSAESIAIDWLSSNVYWADATLRRIEVAKLNGHYRRTLFWSNLNEPRTLVLDPREGYMFWSECIEDVGSIMKASMDGSAKRAIVEDIGRVYGLTIDYSQRYLYWTHSMNDHGYIEQCDANGQNRRQILKQASLKPYSITQNQNYLFWTKHDSTLVMELHKYNTASQRVLYSHTSQVTDVRIVDPGRQGGWNRCAFNNGGCKYLCLVRPGFASHSTEVECACPTHYTMREGTCQPPDNFLLFSQRNSLYRLTTSTNECPDFPLFIPGLKAVRAIEYDAATKYVYWIDGKASAIRRSAENGTNSGIVLGGNDTLQLCDIALEPFSKLLFWSSSATNSINVTWLNNSSTGCIFESKNGEKPRNLALHPEKGLIFWTDVGLTPRIIQSRLNGDKQSTIDTESRLVDALTVDRRSNLLYLTYGGDIYEYDITDRNKRLLLKVGSEKVSSLAVTRSFLYWLDRESQRIERVSVNVNTVSDRMVIVKQIPQITDLIAVDPLDDTYPSHPCSSANHHGNCSHLCLPSVENIGEAECGCPVNLQLSDNHQTCVISPPKAPNYITCRLRDQNMVCDGNVDCEDGSDEMNCDAISRCPDGSFDSPELCNSATTHSVNDKYVEDGKSIQFFMAFFILISVVVVGVCFYCKQKFSSSSACKHNVAMMRPLATVPSLASEPVSQPVASVKSMSFINGHDSVISYEHSLATGISSSTSMIHCPLNPPPSPTTTTMQQDECCCGDYSRPTPTPCSTDVCDESDASYPVASVIQVCCQQGNKVSIAYHKRFSERSSRHRQRRQNRHQRPNYDYKEVPFSPYRNDFEVGTPPPTPYTSNPPSPSSSIRSRPFNIPPPPPTPSNSLPDDMT